MCAYRVLLRHGAPDRGDGRLCRWIILGCKCVGVFELCSRAIHFVGGAVVLYLMRGWNGTSTITFKSNSANCSILNNQQILFPRLIIKTHACYALSAALVERNSITVTLCFIYIFVSFILQYSSAGASACASCSSGTYQATTGSSSCTACTAGERYAFQRCSERDKLPPRYRLC